MSISKNNTTIENIMIAELTQQSFKEGKDKNFITFDLGKFLENVMKYLKNHYTDTKLSESACKHILSGFNAYLIKYYSFQIKWDILRKIAEKMTTVYNNDMNHWDIYIDFESYFDKPILKKLD